MYRDTEAGLAFHQGNFARHPLLLRLVQLVNFLFGVLYALLATRFVLVYVQARNTVFGSRINEATAPVVHPFQGVIANGHDPAGHPIACSIVLCVAAVALVNVVVVRALRTPGKPASPVDD